MKKDHSQYLSFLALLTILAVFFYKVLFLGYSLWPADAIFSMPPWDSHAPLGYRGPSNYVLFDNTFVFYPWFHLASQMLQSGEFPLWNPYSACGLPFFANSTGFLFPLNIGFFVMPLWYAFGLVAFLKLFLAGAFTFLFLRALSIRVAGALIAAVSFMLCGFMIVWLGHPQTNIALCLPLLFLLTEKLVLRKNLRSASILALAVGASFLGGHYETTAHVLAAAVLYFLFRLLSLYSQDKSVKNAFRLAGLFSTALAIGTGLAAVQILPGWEYIQQSSLIAARAESAFHLDIGAEAFKRFFGGLKALVLYIVPDFFGNPAHRNEWGTAVGMWNYVEQSGYAGVLPLYLAVLAVAFGYKNRSIAFFGGLAILSLAVTHRMPFVADIVHALPVFAKLNNNRIVLVYCFSIAVLAGFGTDMMMEQQSRRDKKKIFFSFAFLMGFTILTAACLWYLIAFDSSIGGAVRQARASEYVSGKIGMFVFWAVAGLTLLLIRQKNWSTQRLIEGVLIVLIAADLLAFAKPFWPEIDRDRIYPATPATDFLSRDKEVFRVFGVGNVLSTNTAVPFNLFDVRGYDGISLRRYENFMTGKSGDITFFMSSNGLPRHIDLMNVKYLLLPLQVELSGDRFEKVYTGEFNIYRNRGRLDRAFVVHRAVIKEDQQEALVYIYGNSFDPSREVVIDSSTPGGGTDQLKAVPGRDRSTAVITQYRPREIVIDVAMQSRGFLVLSNTYYPGWKAYIDGRDAHIYRADYAFQAVAVEKGRHHAVFRYEPASFRYGAITSFMCLLAVIGGATFRFPHKDEPRKGTSKP